MKNLDHDVNASKGRRYTRSEKEDILAFVARYNAEHGRGGQNAAVKKFKVSPLSISAWARHGGFSPAAGERTTPSSGNIAAKLEKLRRLHDRIVSTEREIARFRHQFDALKRSL